MLRLSDYPDAIAQKQRQLLQNTQHARRLQDVLDRMTAEIDTSIAFDFSLKNDAQRKARRMEMMRSPEYRRALNNLLTVQDQTAELEIDLGLLRNQFSALKLELRERITSREMQLMEAA